MTELEEFNLINQLLDVYGSLLTENQVLIMQDYYAFNLSLSEISEQQGISRSAVLDSIKHSKEKLFYYEEKLHILEKNKKIADILKENNIDGKIVKKLLEEL